MAGERSVDTDRPADEAWILSVQRKLYQWSKAHPNDAWRDMWGWMTDLRMLRAAWRRVALNKGKRTAGIDGMTVGRIRAKVGEQRFLEELQAELRSGAYRPSPSRRKLIPKAGKPGQFRPLGIPTVKDRVAQGAIKLLLEPIFEAQFWNVSYGFRPGRSVHGALERIRLAIQPRKRDKDGHRRRLPYRWIIEGDIKGCFDNLSHHHLLNRLRQRVVDGKMIRLVGRFLKAGVLAEDQFLRTDNGTPQGGIVSPLLSNIALSAIEERYERWVYHRSKIRGRRAHYPMVAFATVATIIASQAITSGAYSLTRQSIQLGFLPSMRVLHTASHEQGQIYMPVVNWLLATGTLGAVIAFGSSDALGGAYGIAVSMLMAITTVLAALVALQWGYNERNRA